MDNLHQDFDNLATKGGKLAPKKVTVKGKTLANGTKQTLITTKPKRKKKKSLFTKVGLAATKPLAFIAGKVAKKTRKKKSVGKAATAILDPLIPSMKVGLTAKGFNVSTMTTPMVIEKFYNEFVSKKADKASSYEPLEENSFSNSYLFTSDYDTFDSDNIVGVADVQMAVNVSKSIIDKFKGWNSKRKAAKKAKKDPKTVMTPVEVKMGEEAEKVLQKAKAEQQQAEPETKGNTKKYLMYGIAGLVVVLIILKLAKVI